MPNGAAGFAGLLLPDGAIPALAAFAKDAAIKALAREAGERLGLPWLMIHDRLIEREAQGETGFGDGVAIPHARIPQLAACAVVVAKLAQPVDWQARDGALVDILVLLLSPENASADHLKALARISRSLRDSSTLPMLRSARSAAEMQEALVPETIDG
jgi:PTS system nitrogen regulatory IIA component